MGGGSTVDLDWSKTQPKVRTASSVDNSGADSKTKQKYFSNKNSNCKDILKVVARKIKKRARDSETCVCVCMKKLYI